MPAALDEVEKKPSRWEAVNDEPLDRVRRHPIPGGWLYQVEVDELRPSTRELIIKWGDPVFVPDTGAVMVHGDVSHTGPRPLAELEMALEHDAVGRSERRLT